MKKRETDLDDFLKKVLGVGVASRMRKPGVPDVNGCLIVSRLRLPQAVCVIGCVRESAQNAKSAPGWSAFSFISNTLLGYWLRR